MKYGLMFSLAIVVLFFVNLVYGSVDIPLDTVVDILLGKETDKASWRFIVLESRLPQAVTALLSGMALSVSGLMLQTAFRNPLADLPSSASAVAQGSVPLWSCCSSAAAFRQEPCRFRGLPQCSSALLWEPWQ